MSRDVQQGELVVDTLAIANLEQESIDIQALTSNITIFEAIDKPFLSGRLTLVDGLNIVKNYRLTGQESLTMRIRQAEGTGDYSTPEFSIEKTFRIYSITDVNRTQQNMQQYVIHFVDPKFYLSKDNHKSNSSWFIF